MHPVVAVPESAVVGFSSASHRRGPLGSSITCCISPQSWLALKDSSDREVPSGP